MKNVLIKITGTQGFESQKDKTELIAEGSLTVSENEFVITYDDEQILLGSKTKSKLTVKQDNTVILERAGELNSKFVITEGERNTCLYAIPQGTMTLGINGKKVINELTENGGRLKMSYTIDANLRTVSENEVDILVEER